MDKKKQYKYAIKNINYNSILIAKQISMHLMNSMLYL